MIRSEAHAGVAPRSAKHPSEVRTEFYARWRACATDGDGDMLDFSLQSLATFLLHGILESIKAGKPREHNPWRQTQGLCHKLLLRGARSVHRDL